MRKVTNMNMHPIDTSLIMTIYSIGFYVLYVITTQGIAAMAAILAGVSTFCYNMYKFYRDYKNDHKKT